MRVSLDAADAATYKLVRGKDFFDRIVRDVRRFIEYQEQVGASAPRISLWLTGLKETVQQLPDFVRLAESMRVREVHLQRLVFDDAGFGMARAECSLFESTRAEEQAAIDAAVAIGRELGVTWTHPARPSPASVSRRSRKTALVHLPAPLVAHVLHRARSCAPVLHRAVLGTRLRQLHAR